ncbi:MAG: ABC transporter ATP-binding protein [Clostridiales bacterium]|nr:ABC transporter ATP-binding protein [Clostridiales bacterium]
MIKLFRYVRPYIAEFVFGPLFKLIEAIIELTLPTIMAFIIDNGVANSDTAYTLKYALIMIGLASTGVCFALMCQYLASSSSQGIGTALRRDMFRKIMQFSPREMDKFGVNSLSTRITNDVNRVQQAFAMVIRLLLRAPFICIGAFIMAFMINKKLSLIFLCVMPLFAVILAVIIKKTTPLYKTVQKKLDRVSVLAAEDMAGVRVIRAFNAADKHKKRFTRANDELFVIDKLVGKISAILNPATTLIINFGIVAILWLGGIEINSGNFSQGELIAFINYISQMLLALIVVSNLIVLFTRAGASASRVNEVLDCHISITEGTLDKADFSQDKIIEFKDVTFSYTSSGENVLTGINFCIRKGEKIGVIGVTGSGKTSLINLIERFYDTTEGEVLYYGKNVKEYTFKALRDGIGAVRQNMSFFHGTIRSNILCGRTGFSDEDILTASKISQLYEVVQLKENGFDSVVEAKGKNLSGGQRQRLAIARAVLGLPELLILDDCTSALDFATEAEVRKAVSSEFKEKTVITISQRVSSVIHCDRIIIMDNGVICDIGTHDELMKRSDIYVGLYNSQTDGGGL